MAARTLSAWSFLHLLLQSVERNTYIRKGEVTLVKLFIILSNVFHYNELCTNDS